jgi:RHS repeat-associated protein
VEVCAGGSIAKNFAGQSDGFNNLLPGLPGDTFSVWVPAGERLVLQGAFTSREVEGTAFAAQIGIPAVVNAGTTAGAVPTVVPPDELPLWDNTSSVDVLEPISFRTSKVWGLAGQGLSNSYQFTVQVLVRDPANRRRWVPAPYNSARPCLSAITAANTIGGGTDAMPCLPCTAKTAIGAAVKSIRSLADPVEGSTGAFYESFTDLAVAGRGPALVAARTYDSGAAQSGQVGMFGPGWASPYDQSLTVSGNGVDATAVWRSASGAQVTFVKGSAGWTASSVVTAKLTETGSAFTATLDDGTAFGFSAPGAFPAVAPLGSITDRNGYRLSLDRSQLDRLVVSNHTAVGTAAPVYQSLTFVLDGSGRALSVSDGIGRTVSYGYTAGDLTSASSLTSTTSGWVYGYDGASHRMRTSANPAGDTTTNAYDATGRVAAQWDPKQTSLGNTNDPAKATQFAYVYATAGVLTGTTTITDPVGHREIQTYANGYLVADEQGVGGGANVDGTTTFGYDPTTGMLAGIVDPNGARTSMTYTAQAWLARQVDPLGNTSTYGLDTATGEYTNFDAFGHPLTVTDPSGTTTTNTYSTGTVPAGLPAGLLLSSSTPLTHPGGATTTLTTTFEHGDAAHPEDVTSLHAPDGVVTDTVYNAAGEPVTVTVPKSGGGTATTYYRYDAVGRQVSVTSARGTATGRAYRATQVINDAGSTEIASDAKTGAIVDSFQRPAGTPVATTDTGETWTTTAPWTISDRQASSTATGGSFAIVDLGAGADNPGYTAETVVPKVASTAAGLVFGYTDPNNYWEMQQFGSIWVVFKVKDGQSTLLTPDGVGGCCTPGQRIYVAVNADHIVVTGDSEEGPVWSDVDPDIAGTHKVGLYSWGPGLMSGGFSAGTVTGSVTNTWFDTAGRAIAVAEPSNSVLAQVTHVHYDPNSRVDVETRPGGTTLKTSWYDNGDLLAQTDGADHATSYTYDARSRIASVTPPSGNTTSYGYTWGSYDLATPGGSSYTKGTNQVIKPGGGALNTTTTALDQDGRPVAVTYGDGTTPNVTAIGYDANSRRSATTVAGGSASAWTYNSIGELVSSTRDAATVAYGYDAYGRPTTTSYPGHATPTTFAYDASGAVTKVFDLASREADYVYDADGNIVNVTTPNGVATATVRDADGAPTDITITSSTATLAHWAYGLNSAQRVTNITATGIGPNQTYGYTPLNQLANSTQDSVATSYGYDPADNPTSLGGTRQTFDTANQLCWTATATSGTCTSGKPAAALTYSYNPSGDRTAMTPATGPATTYGYDQADRLHTVTGIDAAHTASYRYDADGTRLAKTVNGTTTNFVWDDTTQNLLQEGTTSYVYGPDGLPLEQVTATTTTYLHQDNQGSTRLQTNTTGAVTATATYNPWGALASHTGTIPTLGYESQYTDPETGFLYLRARYYDPATAQFLTRDPLDAMTRSAYGYVGNDPLNRSDPSGMCGFLGSGSCSFSGITQDVKHDAKAAASYAKSWVPNCVAIGNRNCTSLATIHPTVRDGLYVTAGAAATVASGGIALDAVGLSSVGTAGAVFEGGLALSGEGLASAGFGLVAASGDYEHCMHGGEQLACAGLIAGGFGAVLGVPALSLELAPLGLLGTFVGAAGLAADQFSFYMGLYDRLSRCSVSR